MGGYETVDSGCGRVGRCGDDKGVGGGGRGVRIGDGMRGGGS